MVFTNGEAREVIDSATCSLENSLAVKPPKVFSWNPVGLQIARSNHSLFPEEFKELIGF